MDDDCRHPTHMPAGGQSSVDATHEPTSEPDHSDPEPGNHGRSPAGDDASGAAPDSMPDTEADGPRSSETCDPPNEDPFAPLGEPNPNGASSPRAGEGGKSKNQDDVLELLACPEQDPPCRRFEHWMHGMPSRVWVYRDAVGDLIIVTARYDFIDGEGRPAKVVLPWVYARRIWTDRQGQLRDCTGWHCKAPPSLRPLYGQDHLAARLDAPVLITEGEKSAVAAQALFPDWVAVCWQGGCNSVDKANWAPLQGRLVVFWPDADEPGRKAAPEVVKLVRAAGATGTAIVAVPADWPDGWDVADLNVPEKPQPEGVTAETLRSLLVEARAAAEQGSGEAASDTEQGGEKEAFAEPATGSRQRVDLYVDGADLPDVAVDLADLLTPVPHLFDRNGPARLVYNRPKGGQTIEPLTVSGVVHEAHQVVRPFRLVKVGKEVRREDITLPERVAKLYLDNKAACGLRPLDGITSAPILRGDGTVQVVDGYDAGTRLWCEGVPQVACPDQPSRADAEAALLRLRGHFRTFAFADSARVSVPDASVPVVDLSLPPGADESALLCGLLTAVSRPCLWLAPGLLVRAPSLSGAGTGKGLLVRAVCAIAFGGHPTAITAGDTSEELAKRISAALMEARPTLFLDNLNSIALKSDVLASVLTERPAEVRVLGRSANVLLNSTAFIGITGNGVTLSEDLVRRFLTVELEAGENPETRDFRTDLIAETLAAREALLRDVLIIWRWGRQMGDTLPAGQPLGSFTQWGRWCRDPLLALGCQDPAWRIADIKARDPLRQEVSEIFIAWWNAHRDRSVKAAELADSVREAADMLGRSRQQWAAKVASLEGTRVAGFVLTRVRTGRWSPDRYVLRQVDSGWSAAL
ncbi:hypothetical protein E0493_11145 [Roseomonas sp. M0104]|uniref:DUF6371 domain-containing protein n=1 Tax=Teichococcus coralli TaxID=2545983 RepID=A0A845B9P7_9PROT|nr:DUF6371 domain-containing protein [Pseudoroseomonas coralli]MXP63901.1 hypothetical protein [Pseudoroseomonas coralli]